MAGDSSAWKGIAFRCAECMIPGQYTHSRPYPGMNAGQESHRL